ncbi:MAG: hypothetical protein EOO85_32065, partial [Pedobacter sp.]
MRVRIYFYQLAAIAILLCSATFPFADEPDFKIRILASGLNPWSVVVAPSGQLWVTESKGYRLVKLDPQNGKRKVMLDLNSRREFPAFDQMKGKGLPTPQGGLMGLALHPELGQGT